MTNVNQCDGSCDMLSMLRYGVADRQVELSSTVVMKLQPQSKLWSNEKSRWLPAETSSLWSEQGAVYMGFGFQTEAWETFAAALA